MRGSAGLSRCMEIGALTQAIIAAVHLLTYTGECAEAEYYPRGYESEVVDYVGIDQCVLPTNHELTPDRVIALYDALNGAGE